MTFGEVSLMDAGAFDWFFILSSIGRCLGVFKQLFGIGMGVFKLFFWLIASLFGVVFYVN